MAILVTGGAGYVGSHTVRLLRAEGRDVIVLDNLERGHRAAVLGAELIVGDTGDEALISRVVADHDIDGVVHFAAYKAPGESMEDPGKYFENNVAGPATMLKALDHAGVRRFVFSSTCAVYGTPTDPPVAETAPLSPESPYGESKRLVEQMLGWFATCRGLQSVSLRYFNAAGASLDSVIGEDWTVTPNLIPVAIKATLGRRPPLEVFGTDYPTPDGTAIRDYIHVLDLADAHSKALAYLEGGGTTMSLNLGTGTGSSVLNVLDALEKVSGMRPPHEFVGRRPGDPAAVWADNRLARQTLGWQPQFGLEDIVRSAWQWHSTHLDGYG